MKNEIIDDMIFPIDEVVSFSFNQTDLHYAVEDSFTDNAISTKDKCQIDTDEKDRVSPISAYLGACEIRYLFFF